MKKFLSILLIFAMIFTFAACSSDDSDNSDQPVATGDGVAENADIVLLEYADISGFNPIDYGTVVDNVPALLIYDGLLALDENGDYVWMLATDCDMSEDGLEYTFKLREGITFSDGEAWNAEAAKINLELKADQTRGYKSQARYACIDKVEAVDEYTVKVTLKQPYAPFLNVLAGTNGSMMSPKLIAEGDDAMATKPTGTGQYTLVERKVGESITFALNRDWWGYEAGIVDKACGYNTITMKPISEEATRVAMLMSGEADIIDSVTPTNQTTLTNAGNQVLNKVGYSMGFFYLNTQKEIFKDVRVRQAIAMAIDVDALNNVVYGGSYVKAKSVLTESIKYFEEQTPFKYDPEAAKKLLADAGYPDGFTVVAWEENDTTDIQRGEFIQQQLEQIGIKLEIYPQEGGFLTENVNGYTGKPEDTEFDCYIRGYSVGTGDADEGLGRFSSEDFPSAGANYSFYSNPEYDALIEQGASSLDDAVRKEAYSKAQKMIWDDVAMVPLLGTCYSAAYGKHISDISFTGSGLIELKYGKYVQ
ncbi:MAG: hypothetical protein HFE73_02175 [Firmicutes bacterium]|nr:hypothetical protein [Bacillota bacterium]